MEPQLYLDFDEAVDFLKTTRSTLYKWLQAGKVPGHKLGRQWRFLRHELEHHVSGSTPKIEFQKELLGLADLLESRAKNKSSGTKSLNEVSENLIWDAYDHDCRMIHISPRQGRYEVRYRLRKGFDRLTQLTEDAFQALDQSLRQSSAPTQNPDARRIYLQGEGDEALQIRYHKLETVSGPRVTLQLFQPHRDVLPLEKIVSGRSEVLAKFKKWGAKNQGLIVIAGAHGSGKTTTVYSLIQEIAQSGAEIFSIEYPLGLVIDGVNHIEPMSKSAASFEEAYERVCHSDPDVFCLGLGGSEGIEALIYQKAVSAAMAGSLVVLQVNAASCEEALASLKQNVSQNFDRALIGVSFQKLVLTPQGVKAQYQLYEPDQN